MDSAITHPASFRDPSGRIFKSGNTLLRLVDVSYADAYDHLIASGLYDSLVSAGWLVAHQERDDLQAAYPDAHKILEPELVPVISYPYEWCFSQYKDAALLTLRIAQKALEHGMILKDASAFNIQFLRGKPVLIDTLSFDLYHPGKPWDGYRQFCQHFLAPLALAAHVDIRFLKWMQSSVDGMPLDLASRLLPWQTRLDLGGLGNHIHLHSRLQATFSSSGKAIPQTPEVARAILDNLYTQLTKCVTRLNWKLGGTEWADYYDITNYSAESFRQKQDLVREYLQHANPTRVWDMGANNGYFSREASALGMETVSSDIDYSAVEVNYRKVREDGEDKLLPLAVDLTNPTPAIGWANTERDELPGRIQADLVLALALIHHICISNNVPIRNFLNYLRGCARWAIVEFVPKEDSQVQTLLRTRKDIFDSYNLDAFLSQAAELFEVVQVRKIPESEHHLVLLRSVDAREA